MARFHHLAAAELPPDDNLLGRLNASSAAAWIIKLHSNDWNVVTAGKIRQEAARKGATLSARAYQHALAKMRRALIQYDKG